MSRELKIVLAVVVVLVAVPVVAVGLVVGVLMLLGALAWHGNQTYLLESKRGQVLNDVHQLQVGAATAAAEGPVAPCGSEDGAMAAARAEPGVKAPPEACLVAFGLPDWPTYGRYWVEVRPDGTPAVHGVADLDRDGVLLRVDADPDSLRHDEAY